MARDYKYTEVFSPGTRPMPFWIWLFAACAISAFVGLIYYLDQYEKTKNSPDQITQKLELGAEKQSAVHSEDAQVASAETKSDEKSRFDFYKLLPIQGVDVSGSQDKNKGPTTTAPLTEKSVTQGSDDPANQQITPKAALAYVLQAGSFKDFKAADRLKASLALQGIVAKIEKVELAGDQVWHRVLIGPIVSEREMNRIRGRLRSQSIEPVMSKVKT